MSITPYPGLRPYEESERKNFFGRDTDSKILIDQILANRLTLLFAASGVGKSSLLKASVIPRLKEPLGENLDVVYFNDWVTAPLPRFKALVVETLQNDSDLEADTIDNDVLDAKLPAFFEFCCLFASQPFVLVLDQFEEFFRYRNNYDKKHFHAFIQQLTDVVIDKSLSVAVVLSMREDYALELNAFKPRLPMVLFENYYRLEKLKPAAAQEAILTPIKRVGFQYEDKLFKRLLDDLLSRDLDRSQGSMVVDTIQTVEPPYLQIICEQLWQRDKNDPDKTIRFATYKKAGYAKGLLDNFIGQQVLSQFSLAEKQLASRAFDHLVSRRGTKMAHTVEDLAKTLQCDTNALKAVLEKLEQQRIVRSQQREEKVWYELYHDMFSHSIDDWNTVWKNKMRIRKSVIGLGIATIAGVAAFLAYNAWIHYNYRHLRMTLSDPYSQLELWQGKENSWDIFGQTKFLAQINTQLKDREPDKRLPQWSVHNSKQLTTELIGSLALKDRVAAFARDGQYTRALKMADDAISATGTEINRSADVIDSLGQIQINQATEVLWDKYPNVHKREKLNKAMQVALSTPRIGYWLNNEQQLINRLTATNSDKAQKSLLIQRLGELVISNKDVLLTLRAQLKDDHWQVRDSVAQALGALGDGQALQVLIAQLKDDSEDVRRSVAQALGELGDAQAIQPLIAQLKDDDFKTRQSVAQALGALGNAHALQPLIAQLKGSNSPVRQSVAQALGALGDTQAVQPLIAQLKDDSEDVRRSVAQALGALGDAQAVQPLIAQLKDDHWQVRQSVVQALDALGDTQTVQPLIAQLKDDDSDMRYRVAQVLGALGDAQQAVQPLIAQLKDDSEDVRRSVAQALGALGDAQAVQPLIAQLKDDSEDVRRSVAQALGALGDAQAVQPLIAQLKDDHWQVRQSVVQALRALGDVQALIAQLKHNNPLVRRSVAQALSDAKAVQPLITQLKDDDSDVRQSVTQALGALGDAQAVQALIEQLKDNDPDVRRNVVRALGTLGGSQALQALTAQLKDDSIGVRQSVAHALGALGDAQAVQPLIVQLKDDNIGIRLSFARALGALGDAQAVQPLIAQLKDDNIRIRLNVALALSELGDAQAVQPLIAQLKDDSENVRSSVALALGALGDAQAVQPLIAQLKDDHWQVRDSVAQALGTLGDTQAVQPLIAQLKDDNSDVRQSIALALGALGDRQALQPLIAQLKDDNSDVRQSIAQALGILGDGQALQALIEQLKDDDVNVRQSVVQALGALGDVQSVQPLITQLKNDSKDILQSLVAQALGTLGDSQAVSALTEVFQQEKEYQQVKVSVALALSSLGQQEMEVYLRPAINDAYKRDYYLEVKRYKSKYETSSINLQALILATLQRERGDLGKKLLLQQFDTKHPVSTQVRWIEAFAGSDTTKALPLLYHLSQGTNAKIKRAALNAIATLETDYHKLLNIIDDNHSPIPRRFQALQTLFKKHPKQAVPYLLASLESKEKLYGHKVWRLMDQLKPKEAQDILQGRIDTIRKDYQEWRRIRDQEEPKVADNEVKENNEAWVKWKEELVTQKPKYSFLYARMLARIDPQVGIKLLEHEIAAIRKGAWYGLASVGDIKLVKQLTDLRLNNPDKPLLRHAAYRAIDLSLTQIQSNGKRSDLDDLQAWYASLKQREMQQEAVDEAVLPIASRVDWVIGQLRYHFRAKAELQRRYKEFVKKQQAQAK